MLRRQFDLASGECRTAAATPELQARVAVSLSPPPIVAGKAERTRRTSLSDAITGALQAAADGQATNALLVAAVLPDPSARRQFSFSRLHGLLVEQSAEPQEVGDLWQPNSLEFASSAKPASERTGNPLALGSLVHEVLAELDFRRPADVRKLVQRHAERSEHDLSHEIETAAEMLERLLASPRARQIATVRESHVELEFLLSWPMGPKAGKSPASDGIYLQGFIDRLDCDELGAWHLVDFKTNRVTEQTLSSVAANYEMQMLVYALAVERSLGVAPRTLTLHFLRTGDEVPFVWNDDARELVRSMIDEGLRLRRTSSLARKRI